MDYLKPKIAIHQPNYLPWIGYFFKIYLVDHFVLHDHVIFSTSSYTKRCLIRKEYFEQDIQKLTIPVKKNSQSFIHEIEIDHNSVKIAKHLKKFEYLFHNTPYFPYYFPILEKAISQINDFKFLADYNIHLIQTICTMLDLETEFSRSSKLGFSSKGHELNLDIIKHIGGRSYFSGVGAKTYQTDEDFERMNCKLIYVDPSQYFKTHPYPQHQGDYIPGLSIIDSIMNVGTSGILEIFSKMKQWMEATNNLS